MIKAPVTKMRMAMIKKSKTFQLTSAENCIAIKGTESRPNIKIISKESCSFSDLLLSWCICSFSNELSRYIMGYLILLRQYHFHVPLGIIMRLTECGK